MINIVYLIGAGASANALPMVKSFFDENEHLRQSLIEELLIFSKELSQFPGYELYHQLCEEAKSFSTPDTFAKFLYVSNRDNDYVNFKIIISTFFFWKERIENNGNNPLDSRVISFLTTLSEKNGTFPKNIKIISWNYDAQFLRAIETTRKSSNSFLHNFKSYPFAKDRTIDKEHLTFIHLNGVAGFAYNGQQSKITNKFYSLDTPGKSLLQYCMERGLSTGLQAKAIIDVFSHPDEKTLISYAWEDGIESFRHYEFSEERMEYATSLAKGADILVVIGYSFPFFNRQIDKELFKAMTLKKIYFQDPSLDGKYLYSQFNIDKSKVDIEHIKDVKNYYVPYEL